MREQPNSRLVALSLALDLYAGREVEMEVVMGTANAFHDFIESPKDQPNNVRSIN